jgi:hypothetical protein
MEIPNFTNPAILLHPNIPKPMHGVNPRTIMGQEWWDEQRQRAYEENNFCCWACGVHKSQAVYHKWLEAHECYEIDYIAGRMYMRIIVALCHSCHNFIHSGRMDMMVRQGQMPESKMNSIIAHGNRIKRAAKLSFTDYPLWLSKTLASMRKSDVINQFAAWADWRMVINDVEYSPVHKSFEEWREFYARKS